MRETSPDKQDKRDEIYWMTQYNKERLLQGKLYHILYAVSINFG